MTLNTNMILRKQNITLVTQMSNYCNHLSCFCGIPQKKISYPEYFTSLIMAVIAVFNVRAKEDPESLQTKCNDAIQENEYEYNMKGL